MICMLCFASATCHSYDCRHRGVTLLPNDNYLPIDFQGASSLRDVTVQLLYFNVKIELRIFV